MAWRPGSSTWDTFRGGISAADLRQLAGQGLAEHGEAGQALKAGFSIVYASGVDAAEFAILQSVGLVTKAMATAIKNKSQMHVPYRDGDLFRSVYVEPYGLARAAETGAGPKHAFAGPGGIDPDYVPEKLSPGRVLAEARSLGFTDEELDEQIEWRVGYDIDYALSVHEGLVFGREVQEWTPRNQTTAPPGLGEPTSHFLSNAFLVMQKKQPLLVNGVMQTALRRLVDQLRPKLEAEAVVPPAAPRALGMGTMRLVKVKVR